MQAFEHRGQWSGYKVHASRTGWVVAGWSAIQGQQTGWRYLVPARALPSGSNSTVDDVLEAMTDPAVRVLRRGFPVR